ncbi:MAG: hypothetical protein RL172_3257 [Bacteroidota bacterium]|jgi:superoxide dismutase, Fe-Mn family
MKKSTRRKFIANTAATSIGTMLAAPSFAKILQPAFTRPGIYTGFDQTPLPYSYAELEPAIDALTMEIHYSKHAAAYCKNLKEAITAEKAPADAGVEKILQQVSKYSSKMRNNAGGHYNHELFWKCLAPAQKTGNPSPKLQAAITQAFGTTDELKKQFTDAAKARFGSGWAWLIADQNGALKITSTPNQDNPLMDIAETKGAILFGLDVWEHAYYLKYQNRRPEYIDNFWKVLNWNYVSERYAAI